MNKMVSLQARLWGGRLSGLLSGVGGVRLRAFCIMAVCARARIGPGLAPFAAAYFAAHMKKDDECAAMLAGCAAGAFITGFDGASLFAPAACALALIGHLLWEYASLLLHRPARDEPARCALTAGLAVLLPGLAAAGYDPAAWAVALISAIVAALLTPVCMVSDSWWHARAQLGSAAAALTLCIAGLGLDPTPAAAFCAMLAGAAGFGALTGAALGTICALSGGLTAFAAVSMMGAASEIAPKNGPAGLWRALCAAAAYSAAALLPGAVFSPWPLAAAALHALIPPDHIQKLSQQLAPAVRRDGRLMRAVRRRDSRRLMAMSDAFGALSQVCGADDPAFGEQQLINRMRAALCAGCGRYAECWPGSNSGAVKLFCQLMTSAIECGGSPFRDGEVPPDIMRLCRRGMTVPSRLGSMLADFAAQRHRRIRLMEARRLIGAQFMQAAEALNAMAAEQARPCMLRDGEAAHVRQALENAAFPVRDVLAVRLDRLEITVELSVRWSRELAERAENVISACLERRFSADSVSGATAGFVPAGAFTADAVLSALPADPDRPCGDSCLIRQVNGSLFVALSDGMGSGEAAAEESCRVVSLMHSMISAGLPRELAVSTVNGVLLSRGGEELFATADMLLVDLDTGRAEFTKLAACRSYIVRGGRATIIEGGRLPLGILDEVRPGMHTAKLSRGDVVFMLTDGVTDALPETVLIDLMLSTVQAAPRDMAQVIINAAAARSGRRRDDMTAVCVRIA